MIKYMKQEEFNFKLNLPKTKENNSTEEFLNDWLNVVNKVETIDISDTEDDKWSTLSCLPQYKFKNLKIENNKITDDITKNDITFKYDDVKQILDENENNKTKKKR